MFSLNDDIRSDLRTIADGLLLLLALCMGVLALFLIFWWDSTLPNPFAEVSPTEFLQTGALIASTALFFREALRRPDMSRALVLVGGFIGCMLIREQDYFLDPICHGCWKWPALALAGSCILYALRRPAEAVAQLARFVRWRWFPVLLTGLVIVLAYSRLFGMGLVWRGMLSTECWHLAKTAMEESAELLGYLLVTFSAVLQSWEFRRRDSLTECGN